MSGDQQKTDLAVRPVHQLGGLLFLVFAAVQEPTDVDHRDFQDILIACHIVHHVVNYIDSNMRV